MAILGGMKMSLSMILKGQSIFVNIQAQIFVTKNDEEIVRQK